jgi:hypothetical protein
VVAEGASTSGTATCSQELSTIWPDEQHPVTASLPPGLSHGRSVILRVNFGAQLLVHCSGFSFACPFPRESSLGGQRDLRTAFSAPWPVSTLMLRPGPHLNSFGRPFPLAGKEDLGNSRGTTRAVLPARCTEWDTHHPPVLAPRPPSTP